MDNKVSMAYAFLSASVSALFGIQLAVAFAALSGAFISVRFCPRKPLGETAIYVALGAAVGCWLVPFPVWLLSSVLHFTRADLPVRAIALVLGFLAMLILEKLWGSVDQVWIAIGVNIQRRLDKWLP